MAAMAIRVDLDQVVSSKEPGQPLPSLSHELGLQPNAFVTGMALQPLLLFQECHERSLLDRYAALLGFEFFDGIINSVLLILSVPWFHQRHTVLLLPLLILRI